MTAFRSGLASNKAKVLVAFATIYFVWGSTYLAIRYALETLPPFLMAGSRFLIAGSMLYAWARFRGIERPTRPNWTAAFIVGGLFFLGGNGGVVWSEQRVPSGLVALLVAMVPVWMVLLDWTYLGGIRPGLRVVFGILLGMVGLGLLVSPSQILGGGRVDPLGALVLMGSTFAWSFGSIFSRTAKLPKSPMLTTAMEMLGGGTLLLVAGLALGEGYKLNWHAISFRSAASLAYLVFFGSIIAFTAYVWLLGKTTTARISTYAYVNPVVAVLLGWMFGGEALTPRMFVAVAVVLSAVVLITTYQAQDKQNKLTTPVQLTEPLESNSLVVGANMTECTATSD